MASILDAIGRALSSAVNNAKKNIGSTSSSNTKNTSSSSDYSNKPGYDEESNTWGVNNPNQSYAQQEKAHQDYYTNTSDGRAEKAKIDSQKEHRDYIENNGGFDNYYNTQQKKYNDAIASGNQQMISALEADSQRVGYTLAPTSQSVSGDYGSGSNVGVTPTAQVQQEPMFDMNDYMNQFNQQNNLYMKQMQDYYTQQQTAFQQQMQAQEQQRLQLEQNNKLKTDQTNAYNQQNKKSITGVNQGVFGDYSITQFTQPKQGAHIKVSNGQPGAISRYLAKDIWANK